MNPQKNFVILSEVVVRDADHNAVDGPAVCLHHRRPCEEFPPHRLAPQDHWLQGTLLKSILSIHKSVNYSLCNNVYFR